MSGLNSDESCVSGEPRVGSDASAFPFLANLDRWVTANPWHPRLLPFVVYIAFLLVIDFGREWSLYTYPLLYAAQCGLVIFLLWRYRHLTPEVTLRFHWLAIPTGLLLCWAWIELGQLTISVNDRFDYSGEEHYFQTMLEQSAPLGWSSLALRLLGMSLLVPVFEELFTRSAMLRGLHRPRETGLGLVQIAEDMPLIGEWIADTRLGHRAAAAPPMFTRQLTQTPLGKLSVFGVAASTLIFMANHAPRDWAGCIACGLVWCWLLWYTNRDHLQPSAADPAGTANAGRGTRRSHRLGLGPIIWSHGITNAALWGYCVYTGDWQWM